MSSSRSLSPRRSIRRMIEVLHSLAEENGPLSVDVAMQYINIGNELYYRGHLMLAEKNHGIALEMSKILLPPACDTLACCYLNLGNDYFSQGKISPALQMHKKAFELYKSQKNKDKSKVANALNSLANDYFLLQTFQLHNLEKKY